MSQNRMVTVPSVGRAPSALSVPLPPPAPRAPAVGSLPVAEIATLGAQLAADVLAEGRQLGRVRHEAGPGESGPHRVAGELLARAVRSTLDVDRPHDGEAAHHDPGRAGNDGHVAQP
jgi:hypothetical protein